MKKTLLFTLSLATINFSIAQEAPGHPKNDPKPPHHKEMHDKKGKTPEERATSEANKLENLLTLTPDQKTKVYDASLKKHQKIKAAKESHKNDADKKALGQEIKASRDAYKTELDTILTPEQQAKLKQHHDEMKAKHDAKKAEMKAKHDAHKAGKPAIEEPDDVEEMEDAAE